MPMDFYEDMIESVRQAFMKKYNATFPRKGRKSNAEESVNPWSVGVGPSKVVYEKNGVNYQLNYSGGPEKPVFEDFKKATEVRRDVSFVPVKKGKKDYKALSKMKTGPYK